MGGGESQAEAERKGRRYGERGESVSGECRYRHEGFWGSGRTDGDSLRGFVPGALLRALRSRGPRGSLKTDKPFARGL